jgi:NADH-quinone oxidoreductase subunit F
VDIRPRAAVATEAERSAVDAALGPPAESSWPIGDGHAGYGGHRARAHRHLLLPALHAVQDEIGWISEGALGYICERLTVPPADAYGVATFYALLSTERRPRTVAHVCDDIACKVVGADRLIASLEDSVGPAGAPRDEGSATWMRSPCLGHCERAPAAFIQSAGVPSRSVAPVGVDEVRRALAGEAVEPAPVLSTPQTGPPRDPGLHLLRRIGVVDPSSLDDYRAQGGYTALRRAVEMGPESVVREVRDSKLMGRGGAAFPTGVKWDAVAKAPVRPHYLICNADESEPGTFKDRVVMEQDPFALIEAMTIAGYATGCEHGYLYIRGEYPLATRRLTDALASARRRGCLGDDVMGEGFTFDIEVRRGAGAYICGEETALMNSIEGYRGEPRNKPPFPTQVGLFGKPTVMNNVETLLNVLDIVRDGGPSFATLGTEGSTGTKLFCVSGAVSRPGVYEVPFGTTLRELLDRSGGIREGRALQTVLLGGAAGSFVTPDQLDLALTFEEGRRAGVSLGSGVVMAFDDRVDITEVLLRIAAFFRDESCGQCVPCRVGTVRQEEALHRIAHGGGGDSTDVAILDELARVMGDASICGLGFTASTAIQSAIAQGLFPRGKAS